VALTRNLLAAASYTAEGSKTSSQPTETADIKDASSTDCFVLCSTCALLLLLLLLLLVRL
jgi:hypothetical protein